MLKFGEFITKHKKIIVILAFLLLIPAIMGFLATRVNYDILVYLPSDIETIQGENILSEDFNMGGFSVVLVDGMKPKQLAKLERSRKCRKGPWNNRCIWRVLPYRNDSR